MHSSRALWLQLLIGSACGNDTTRLKEPEANVAPGLPALDASRGRADPERPPTPPSPADAGQPTGDAGDAPDAGLLCAPAAEVPLRLRWIDAYFSPGCVYFPASLVGSELVGPTSGASARLLRSGESLELQLPGGARFRQRGSATRRGRDLVFQRVLQCRVPQFGFTPGEWRVTEELSGSWIGTPPTEGCTDPELTFTGVYRYDECELQFDRSCLQGPALGNCSVSARFELARGEADAAEANDAIDAGAPPELDGDCKLASAACEGAACAPLGAACTRNEDCALGMFCDDLACSGARACALVPDVDSCPSGLEAQACGCDGILHESVCLANAQALSATSGPCNDAIQASPF